MNTPGTRLFAIAGGTIGVVAPLFLLFITRKMSTPWAVACFAIYVVAVLVIGLSLWRFMRKLRCPECRSPNARLVYNESRAESVACPDCGLRRPTGYSLPDW